VVAEGIEIQEDLDLLKALGVKYGQGFFWGKPLELSSKVSKHSKRAEQTSDRIKRVA